jgi:hypothetical protein
MAIRKSATSKEPLHISSLALTPSTEITLKRISRDATDVVGRTVSDSAVVRALLRYVAQQPLPWVREHVYPHLEAEMSAGVLWGKKRS